MASEEQKEVEGNKVIDLGSLCLYDNNAIEGESVLENIEKRLLNNVQFIFNALRVKCQERVAEVEALPEEKQIHTFEHSDLYLPLPISTIVFPRAHKLPEEKPETKWEKFAKEKGIKKRKREGMVYDNELKKRVARWGKNSAKNEEPAIIEEKNGKDPFVERRNTKKLQRSKQKLKELKNIRNRVKE